MALAAGRFDGGQQSMLTAESLAAASLFSS